MIKTDTVTETTTREVSWTACDLCGNAQNLAGDESVIVEHRTGESYYKGSLNRYAVCGVDLCAGCFAGKLLPWLESQGAVPHAKQYDDLAC